MNAAERLDHHLRMAIAEFSGPIGAKKMPEVGGKSLAADLRVKLPDLRKLADELRMRAAGAATAFTVEAGNVKRAIMAIEDEAAEMAKVANELLGNNPPETTDVT